MKYQTEKDKYCTISLTCAFKKFVDYKTDWWLPMAGHGGCRWVKWVKGVIFIAERSYKGVLFITERYKLSVRR